MRKPDLAQEAAKRQGLEPAAAADQLDRTVTRIVKALRSGHRAHLPGLGTINPGKKWTFRPEDHEQ